MLPIEKREKNRTKKNQFFFVSKSGNKMKGEKWFSILPKHYFVDGFLYEKCEQEEWILLFLLLEQKRKTKVTSVGNVWNWLFSGCSCCYSWILVSHVHWTNSGNWPQIYKFIIYDMQFPLKEKNKGQGFFLQIKTNIVTTGQGICSGKTARKKLKKQLSSVFCKTKKLEITQNDILKLHF